MHALALILGQGGQEIRDIADGLDDAAVFQRQRERERGSSAPARRSP
jgi:hypothetical protein